MSIKYYQLAKDEALPDEFCAVRDVGGEPSEYVFYVPDAENAKLRKFMSDILTYGYGGGFLCSDGGWSCPYFQKCFNCPVEEGPEKYVRRGCKWLALAHELGVEVP